jgi:hypothetical protein
LIQKRIEFKLNSWENRAAAFSDIIEKSIEAKSSLILLNKTMIALKIIF